jgi:hypothetical protein
MRTVRILTAILSLSVCLMAAESPLSGTWKFNPSKGHPIRPLPKSIVAHIDADDTNFKFSEEGVDEKDQPFKLSYEAKFDGKDYPVTGDPDVDTVSLKRVNEREVKFTSKKAGKVVATIDAVVSKDGKSTTVNSVDYSKGKSQKSTAVYDKQ